MLGNQRYENLLKAGFFEKYFGNEKDGSFNAIELNSEKSCVGDIGNDFLNATGLNLVETEELLKSMKKKLNDQAGNGDGPQRRRDDGTDRD
jgi:hypothetical protein